MIFKIRHRLTYAYGAPATLGPQAFRLRPRADGGQRLMDHTLTIAPLPSLRSAALDEHGNVVEHAWFVGRTEGLSLEAESAVETLRANPFDFVVDEPFPRLPWGPELARSHPVASQALAGGPEPEAAGLAKRLAAEAGGGLLPFLMRLNRWIHEHVETEPRRDGAPRPAERTLALGRGACRDLAVLFAAAARAQGVPARFVSGYHEGDPSRRQKELHAWAEVFLPGAGWRGFDPSLGLAVADRHVALAAAPEASGAAAVTGSFTSASPESRLEAEVLFL